MNIERPASPSATMVAPTSTRRSTSIETKRSRLASERPPKKGVATKNAFRSGELTAIGPIYSRSRDLTAPYGVRAEMHFIRVLGGEECIENARPFHRMMAARRVYARPFVLEIG